MTKLTNFFSGLTLLAIGGLIFSSCSSSTSTMGGVSTGVSVTSATPNSLTVGWTRDASDNGTDTLIVTTASFTNAGNSPVLVTNGASGSVTGLLAYTQYTIIVASANGRSTSITYTTPHTSLQVLSVSSTSIGATWTRGAGDNGVDTLVAMNGSTVAGSVLVSSGNTGAVTGLSDGVVYTLYVHDGIGFTNSNTMSWMTADRTMGVQIYETNDPSAGDPSALILGSTSMASSISGISNADFVLESITDGSVASGISLVSGQVHNSAWNATRVEATSPDHPDYIVGGLNADYDSTSYQADQAASNANSYDIPNDNVYGTKGSRVLITTTANGNLALVEIVPDPSGTLYSMSGSYKYITVNVSYQSIANEPYAARGRAIHSSGPVARVSAR